MTELGTTWERESLGGGKYRHTQHMRPIAYRDGIMRRINNDWQDGDEQRPHMVTAAPFLISVGNDGMRRIHPTREMDRYLEMGAPFVKIGGVWQQVSLGQPERTGNRLKWTTNNANMYVNMGGHFIKSAILLKNGWRPPDGQFAFPIGLTGLTRQGGQLFADGQPVMSIRAPHVEDYDDPSDVRPVAHDFVQVNGQWYVLFTLPSLAGMSRPLVDPTLTLQPGAAEGEDVAIWSANPTWNYGVWANMLGFGPEKGLIRFNLSAIPSGAICTDATLTTYHAATTVAAAWTVTVFAVASGNTAWIEGTLNAIQALAGEPCWNALAADGAGGVTTAWTGSAGLSTADTDYETPALGSFSGNKADAVGTPYPVNLTAARVTGWFGTTNTNYGLLLVQTVSDTRGLASSDHATAAYRPKLVVEYRLARRKRLLHIPGTDIDPQHFHRFGRI